MPDNTIYENVDDEDFYSYASPGYLGETGMTLPCVNAMVAILTSPFRPKKITMVSLSSGQVMGKPDDDVLFFIWDWPRERNGTVIPDGFGTHFGEGGTGLAAVLGLIRFCGVPLEHVILYDEGMFDELAKEGKLAPRMFASLKSASPYSWHYYDDVSEVRQVKRGSRAFLEVGHWTFPLLGAMKG